jgi:hypothetical protein
VAAEAGQETGSWTISRTGDVSAPLSVHFGAPSKLGRTYKLKGVCFMN